MKLKFVKAVAVGQRDVYMAGAVYDVKDEHAAGLYIKHGYAEAAPGGAAIPAAGAPTKANTAGNDE